MTQATRATIQKQATTRTHKTRKAMTATTVIMMEMTLQKRKYFIITLTLADNLRQPREWIRKSQEWTAPRKKSQEWMMTREL